MDNRRELYQKAKKGNEEIVVVEGVHAFKHASRFGTEFIDVVTDDKNFVLSLMSEIATDADVKNVEKYAVEIDEKLFDEITTDSLRTKITALAKKPVNEKINDEEIIVFLENPHDIDNVGAVMRVAAAAGAGAVCVSGEVNPWHLHAIRAGAGLQFALVVKQVKDIAEIAQNRKMYACDANGKNMKKVEIEKNAILVFGAERDGISEELKNKSDEIISIPMQAGVSSLNLATSVSAILFGANFK
ncbi:MAG: TrmH family RNA methyltransferase [Patescibacteria group bacterium]|nr:TrmH family RNA methyltransferase [Patescibacteria group bacterium]